MLNTLRKYPIAGSRTLEQESPMDGAAFLDSRRLTPPRGHEARFLSGQAKNVLLMATIVVVTFASLILLDQAGVHLAVMGDLSTAAPLD